LAFCRYHTDVGGNDKRIDWHEIQIGNCEIGFAGYDNSINPHLIIIKFNSVGWFSFTVTTQDLVDTKQDLAQIKAELMKKLDGKCIIRALLYN
jgi:hypothetical protein